ncbi:unnamed protein product, partial [Polarella glacialis]
AFCPSHAQPSARARAGQDSSKEAEQLRLRRSEESGAFFCGRGGLGGGVSAQ